MKKINNRRNNSWKIAEKPINVKKKIEKPLKCLTLEFKSNGLPSSRAESRNDCLVFSHSRGKIANFNIGSTPRPRAFELKPKLSPSPSYSIFNYNLLSKTELNSSSISIPRSKRSSQIILEPTRTQFQASSSVLHIKLNSLPLKQTLLYPYLEKNVNHIDKRTKGQRNIHKSEHFSPYYV